MDSHIRVKVTASSGDQSFTEFWKLRVEDADTGKLLLVFTDGFSIHEKDGAIVLTGAVLVDELNIECEAVLTEQPEQPEQFVRPPETADEFIERTYCDILGRISGRPA